MNRWFNVSICWTEQQELYHHTGWSIASPRPLYAHIQEGNALVKAAQLGLSRRRTRRGLARLLVLLPRRFLTLGGAVEGVSPLGNRIWRGGSCRRRTCEPALRSAPPFDKIMSIFVEPTN